MNRTLITFLGRGQYDARTGYRMARYRMPDGRIYETSFIGRALTQALHPQHVLLLGTAGSMWSTLLENLGPDTGFEEQRLALLDAEQACAVTQAQLDAVSGLVSKALGHPVILQLIGSARDQEEQLELLCLIAQSLPRGPQRLDIDLTHGYRHLAAIGLVSGYMLQALHPDRLHLQDFWYGALDMTQDGLTPVLRLQGLDRVQRWTQALARHEASGDYGVFADLLEADGFPREMANCLRRASDYLAATNVAKASEQIKTLLRYLEQPLQGPSELFRGQLQRHLAWARPSDLAEQQRLLALKAHRRGDWLRASILGIEAYITRLCQQADVDPLNYQQRESQLNLFQNACRVGDIPEWKKEAFWLLCNLRNAMAHGTPPRISRHQQVLSNPDRLRRELEAVLSRLSNP